MTHGIAVFDSERRLVLCNDLFLDLHGYSREFASPGRAYQEIVRENARRGEYGPSDIDEHVVRQ
ncbi:MAG: hybrid sensor histidine kinase/response regulator, partial [Alphaproteobacteria bacterium]|nr:hybrid sensor histidine kinase/response regulator [Alphaproteobacteria bacterium]